MISTVGFSFLQQYFYNWTFLRWIKYCKHQFLLNEYIIAKLRDLFINEIFLWSDYFERTWVWSEPFSSALEFDRSLIKVWAMVWIWVWTMVWRWSDHNAFGLKGLIREPVCLESLIRGNLGLESLIRDNLGLENLIRQKFWSGPQTGIGIKKLLKCPKWGTISCQLLIKIFESMVRGFSSKLYRLDLFLNGKMSGQRSDFSLIKCILNSTQFGSEAISSKPSVRV